jgi:preprotein translocase subunit SecD
MKIRILVIMAAVIASFVALLPTIAPSFEAPWLPTSRIKTDLPFEAGTYLLLDVEVDEAVISEVMRDMNELKWKAESDGVRIATIKRNGTSAFQVSSDESPDLLTRYVENHLVAYEHIESFGEVHRFKLTEENEQALREGIIRNAVRVLEGRTSARCRDDVNIEQVGSRQVSVDLKGMDSLDVINSDDCP